MNRRDLKDIAHTRLREAEALLKSRQYSGAYYLCGYAVECALKACIARQTRQYDFPDKSRVARSYTHDIETLVDLAGLDPKEHGNTDPIFATYWATVKGWSEASRYDRFKAVEAADLYKAIANPDHGVLAWIKRSW